jgi:DNA uptake protein ComE-like DNA-binding protein
MRGRELQFRFVAAILVLASFKACLVFMLGEHEEGQRAWTHLPTLKVDLSTSSWPELSWLPGIGPKTAKGIVAYRARFGVPLNVHMLPLVPGVGESTANGIMEWYEQQAAAEGGED